VGSPAERAQENSVEFYRLLADLKQSVILGALAGLYHQWEKQLREFIEIDLAHDMRREDAAKMAWSREIANVFEFLTSLGWDVRAQSFFPILDACRLVVNVCKHGQGRSLRELAEKFPAYLRGPLGDLSSSDQLDYVHYDWLTLGAGESMAMQRGS